MELASAIGLLIVGFVVLIKGADFLVDGASAIAKRFNISDMIIGLTIVSFGTSAPELVISIGAAMKGESALVMGNVLGSNIYNICLILGAAGLIYPLTVQTATVRKELPFSLFIVVLLFVLANDTMIFGSTENLISHIDGIILLIFFGGFLYYIYNSAKSSKGSLIEEEIQHMPFPKSALLVVGGLVGLIWGGDLVVTNAKFLAEKLGMTERIIGLTVIAIGTSLPEFATSVVAALKKNSDIAIGNVVGSNIFNILLVLGCSATVSPKITSFDIASNFDIYFLIFISILLSVFIVTGNKGSLPLNEDILDSNKETSDDTVSDVSVKPYVIERWQSAILLVIVLGYTIYLLMS